MEKYDVVYLHICLEDPLTPGFIDEFEKLGFFFGGIIPRGLDGRDCLVLQCQNNLEFSFDNISVYSNEGAALLGYIKECHGARCV